MTLSFRSSCVGLRNVHMMTSSRQKSISLIVLLLFLQVSEFLGTEHHEFYFTVQEGIDAVQDVIYHLETYDVTTIRAGKCSFHSVRF